MASISPRFITLDEITHILHQLQLAEFGKDFDKFIDTFKTLNWDIFSDPDFSNFDLPDQARLLRSAAYFLAHYGRAKSLPSYQERGKDVFTRAIEIFEDLGDKRSAIEAQIQLATVYWFEGEFSEAEILQEISESKIDDHRDQLYLLLKVNSLAVLWKKDKIDVDLVLAKIAEIENLIDKCEDLRLCAQFHSEAGMGFRRIGDFQQAETNYLLAIKYSRKANLRLQEALTLNNLAFLKLSQSKFEPALKFADDSLEILRDLGHTGWIPHALDTKAQIYFRMAEYDEARGVIHEAVMKFRTGEDYHGLCDALWLETKIFFAIEMREWALESFRECLTVAKQRLRPELVRKYENDFLDLIYVSVGETFDEKIENYQRYLLESVFRRTKSFTEAARLLGFSNTSRLTAMVHGKFSDMIWEFGLKTKNKSPEKIMPISPSEDFIFNFVETDFIFDFYQIPERFGFGKIIAVSPAPKIKPGSMVVFEGSEIAVGKLTLSNGKWLVEDILTGEKWPADEVEFLGQIIAKSDSNNVFKKIGD